jgi:hypothetical protein
VITTGVEDADDFKAVAQQHGCRVVYSDYSSGWVAKCSCGWNGKVINFQPRGMALAEHAAHVHVAAGLALEDEAAEPYDDDDPPTTTTNLVQAIRSEGFASGFAAGFAHAVALLRDEASRILMNSDHDRPPSLGRIRKHESWVHVADFLQTHAPKETPHA